MRRPNSYLMTWALVLIGSGIYLGARMATAAGPFRFSQGGLAAILVVLGILLTCRVRWTAELVAAVFVFLLLWAAIRMVGSGVTTARVGMAVGAVLALTSYPELRRNVRGGA
jgi:uncharacterized membrane protein YjdF